MQSAIFPCLYHSRIYRIAGEYSRSSSSAIMQFQSRQTVIIRNPRIKSSSASFLDKITSLCQVDKCAICTQDRKAKAVLINYQGMFDTLESIYEACKRRP